MNRYPVWKYAIMLVALLVGLIYTLPNFFGEAPAVQVSPAKSVVKVDPSVQDKVKAALAAAQLSPDMTTVEADSMRVRFTSTDAQIKARDVIEKTLNTDPTDPSYVVALNLVSRSPAWLTALHAAPMYLGLDLRGGVHFMLQVDMKTAVSKRLDTIAGDVKALLRDKSLRYDAVARAGDTVQVNFADATAAESAKNAIEDAMPDMQVTQGTAPTGQVQLVVGYKPPALVKFEEQALKQNIMTLHNRINELGVAEPVIQQQGLDRVVVQLPGVQDTAKAKEILGRTATLEVRMVDESTEGHAAEAGSGPVPFGSEKFNDRSGHPVIVKSQVLLTGENLTDAQPGFDSQTQEPTVNLTLDSKGSTIFRNVTRDNVGKRMAILLFEKGKGEVVTAPVIRTEIGGGRVQISGRMSTQEAADTSLLLRAGSLAAPMDIVEERTIGPSLGADNISKGFHSVAWGFLAVVVFMILYYHLFGLFSALSLAMNLLLLVAILSMLQATLTLPGMAAMALALGMAIDSNVLINERIREELRNGVSPQGAIQAGYQHAWATILDSNVTSLIAGLALLTWGTGPVRGFAVVHCLGIVTSMFSSVFFSRGLVNLWYGRKRKLKSLSIGTVWKPAASHTDSLAALADKRVDKE